MFNAIIPYSIKENMDATQLPLVSMKFLSSSSCELAQVRCSELDGEESVVKEEAVFWIICMAPYENVMSDLSDVHRKDPDCEQQRSKYQYYYQSWILSFCRCCRIDYQWLMQRVAILCLTFF